MYTTTTACQFKGGLYPLTALNINSTCLEEIENFINKTISQAPNFFKSAPVIIDLKEVNLLQEENINLSKLKNLLLKNKLICVGLKNANENQIKFAQENNLAIIKNSVNSNNNNKPIINNNLNKIEKPSSEKLNSKICNKLITEPVRSGQQIFAPNGDLIITNSVGQGAEVIAAGNIHIYGTLRGRALAGVNGDKTARIFCSNLEAELVSIAGQFMLSEQIEQQAWKVSVEILFDSGNLQICKI